jgi:hypothetical protein
LIVRKPDQPICALHLDALIGMQLLQPALLLTQLLQADQQGRVHAAAVDAPLIERGIADAMLTAQVRDGRAALSLLQNTEDLAVATLGLLC